MRRLISFLILCLVKTFSQLFYRQDFKWIGHPPVDDWTSTRMVVLLNHTSLYEPLYIQVFSYSYLWHLAAHLNVPGADITLKRPLVGRFWKLMIPDIKSISRKKDATWLQYLRTIKKESVIFIAPEGRMKRPNGLDKSGRPMSIKGGITDIIDSIDEGGMILCLSGGLHHIQIPGQLLPRLFQPLKMNLIYIDIPSFKAKFTGSDRERKLNMIDHLEALLAEHVPEIKKS